MLGGIFEEFKFLFTIVQKYGQYMKTYTKFCKHAQPSAAYTPTHMKNKRKSWLSLECIRHRRVLPFNYHFEDCIK
jgi:hypothetical protein